MRRWVVVGGCGGGGAVVGLYIMATREWIKINFLLFIFTEHLTIIDTINFLQNRISTRNIHHNISLEVPTLQKADKI